jgi:hypothetical protein
MDCSAQSLARDLVATTFRARVPSGSASTLSGNLFAAAVRVRGWTCQGLMWAIVDAQWTTTCGLSIMSENLYPVYKLNPAGPISYFTFSSTCLISASLLRSSFRIVSPSARERPVPLAVQLLRSKALRICRPSKPVAPVTKTVLSDIVSE